MAGQLLVRRPPKSLAAGIVSHIEDNRDSIDYQLALSQWQRYTQVYRDRGWTVKEIEKDDALPDSVFVEDGVVFVGSPDESSPEAIFIIASPGNVAREGEIVAIEADLRSSSKHQVVRIEKPGTLDGGDVLKVPSQRIIYIGQSQRTNDDGIRQFTTHVSSLGWKVRKVPVKKALHLSELRPLASTDEGRRDCVESMITALPDGTVIGYEPLLEDSRLFPSFLPVQEVSALM